jgi:hypothetical protein
MATIYRIHPGIGIARLGNSPDEFCISPEEPAALPLYCDSLGNPLLTPDGTAPLRITTFKDAQGRIKRQAARFQVYAYDEASPEGRPLELGDAVEGGGNAGVLVDIQWRVYLANKKAAWYEFRQLAGEHGYAPEHPRRNAGITDPEARQRLIVDPGPRSVDCRERRSAHFSRGGSGLYAPTFPPPLSPHSIDTLGEIKTDDSGRLLVLGGHGNSGTFEAGQFGQPRIDDYANNDGWFDDTSDGPVMARLVMYSPLVERLRYVDVEYPAWVIVGYPAYVPQILDMVTMDDVLYDLAVRELGYRTDLYGEAGTFGQPQRIDPADEQALIHWRAGNLAWNLEHKPWFYRDIWPILFRPDEFSYLTNVLGQSNFPHNQSRRGNFDPSKLSVPPVVDWPAVKVCEQECLGKHRSGQLLVEALAPVLAVIEKQAGADLPPGALELDQARLRAAVAGFAGAAEAAALTADTAHGEPPADFQHYLGRWRAAEAAGSPAYVKAREDLDNAVEQLLEEVRDRLQADRPRAKLALAGAGRRRREEPARPSQAGDESPSWTAGDAGEDPFTRLRSSLRGLLRKYYTGQLLEACRRKCVASHTDDPFRSHRQYLFDLLRQPGEENHFRLGDKASSRTHNLPLMPLLAGDNPLSNTLPSKFLRLTDFQFFLLRQWAQGLFFDELQEGWAKPDHPWQPYAGWVNRTGRDLDRGVLSNLLGGAFCPGGEVGWMVRNPAIYREQYRLKADPGWFNFRLTAAQANAAQGQEADYASYVGDPLSQESDFDHGLQPGDLTKQMALPWQADFNECSSETINVTYEEWNQIFPRSNGDALMQREQQAWETLWWPAHRPLQTFEPDGKVLDWSRGIPQTHAGDLKMVTAWWRLAFVRRNPLAKPTPTELPPPAPPPYVAVERSEEPGQAAETAEPTEVGNGVRQD